MKIFKKNENRIVTLLFPIVMIIVCSPLFTRLCINGHDLEYHLLRIESLKEGILMGKPFLKVNVLFMGGAGYASSMFYPDFLLYIPALLRVFGVGINASYHIFIAVCMALTYGSSYYCVKKMTGSGYAASMAAILMTMSPYFLGDIYIRSAVGEFTAFIFLPLVFYGIYNLLYEEGSRPWILGLGYGGVLLCHTVTFIFCLLFGLCAVLIKWKVFRERIRTLWTLFLTVAFTAGLTSFYWLPMLEQLLYTKLHAQVPWIPLEQSLLQLSEVFSLQFPALGYLPAVLALVRLLVKKNAGNRDLISFADWMLIAAIGFTLLSTGLIPWERLNGYLSFVQFPWRFLLLSSALFALCDAIYLYCFLKSSLETALPGSMKMFTVLLLIISAGLTFTYLEKAEITYYDYADDYYSYKPFTETVIAGEWLPQAVTDPGRLVSMSDKMTSDQGTELPFVRVKNRVEAELEKPCAYVDVPLVYYRGYAADLTTENGKKSLYTEASANNGICRVYTDGETGHLRVYYRGTRLQFFSYGLSLTALALLIGYAMWRKKKQQKF